MDDDSASIAPLLSAHLVVVVGAVVASIGAYLVVPSPWVLAVAAVYLGAAGVLVAAHRAATSGRPARAVALVTVASWSAAVAVTACCAWMVHLTPLCLLLPVILVLPYVDRRQMSMIVLATVMLAAVVSILARLDFGVEVQEYASKNQRTAVLAVFIPLVIGLVVLQAWHNHAGLTRQADALQASRRRLVTATDDVRRQIERDLHDSTQQRLVAIAIQLRIAQRLIDEQPQRASDLLDRLIIDTQDTAVELRELSHGVYPPELTQHGLTDALDLLAQRSTRPVIVDTDHVGRYRVDVETTVYFCCLEALQNVVKHTTDDTHLTITIDGRGPLSFHLTDNGPGFPTRAHHGRGLLNMADRVGALGGTLEVRSTPGRGTHITGTIPAPPPATDPDSPAARPVPAVSSVAASASELLEADETVTNPSSLRGELLPTIFAGVFAVLVTAAVNMLVLRGHEILMVVVATTLLFVAPSVVAAVIADAHPPTAVVLVTAAYWAYALVLTWLVPWTFFITPLIVLLPVVLAIPYATRRQLRILLVSVMLVALALTLLGRAQDGIVVHSPWWLTTGLLLTFVPLAVLLVVLQAWHNHAGLTRQADALQASRRRLVTATDDVRRQIERDLHDSTQQRLVAIAIQLRIAQRLIDEQPQRASDLLDRLIIDTQDTAVELRELSHGVYPPELTQHGLTDALDLLAQRSTRPVIVDTDHVGRYRVDVETTVYFCCLEALQNVVKHTTDDTHLTITIDGRGPLSFHLTDNGPGFPTRAHHGRGLLNMADRVGALGGTLEVRSTPGRGTHITGTIPAPPPATDPDQRRRSSDPPETTEALQEAGAVRADAADLHPGELGDLLATRASVRAHRQ